jgi:hypothetical protein
MNQEGDLDELRRHMRDDTPVFNTDEVERSGSGRKI